MPNLERSPLLFGDGRSPTAIRRDRIRLAILALVTLVLVLLGRLGISAAPVWPLWRPVLSLSRSFSSSVALPSGSVEIVRSAPPLVGPGEIALPALGVLPVSGDLLIGGGSDSGVQIGATVLAPPSRPGGFLRYVGRIRSVDRFRSRAILPRDPASLLPVAIEGLGADGFLARGTGREVFCQYLTAEAARSVGYDSRVLLAPVALPLGREREGIEVGLLRGAATIEGAFFSVPIELAVEPARLEWVIVR